MATRLRPIGHEDRLSLVEHLDELRNRLVACALVFTAAFALCGWQNDRILEFVQQPLEEATEAKGDKDSKDPLERAVRFQRDLKETLLSNAAAFRAIAAAPRVDSATRGTALAAARKAEATARAAPTTQVQPPVTLGVTEPFVTTFTVASYAALLLVLPFLLYQAYAFVLPAFRPDERRVALPLMTMVPVLFLAGVAFAYFFALPPAIKFLVNFNDDAFDILVQAKDYFRFAVLLMAAMGLMFQVPVGVLLLTRLGVVTPRQLRANRRYAILIASIVAAVATPSVDPVTMIVTMAPLIVLYELSILLASLAGGRESRWDADAGPSDHPDED